MRLFLDTANLDEVRQGAELGVVSGVTTNPSLAAREGIGDRDTYRSVVLEIARIIHGPISVEVTARSVDGMVEQALDIATWHPNVVVKLPSTRDGFRAMAPVAREGIPINQTLCFSVNQALLGAQAGVAYVSPFVGGWTTPAIAAWTSWPTSSRSTGSTRCRRKSWPPASDTRCTASRRRRPGRTSPRCRSRC